MIRGLVKANRYEADQVSFTDIDDERSNALLSDVPGVCRHCSTKIWATLLDVIVIAVEPKDTPAVCAELCSVANGSLSERVIISLAAA